MTCLVLTEEQARTVAEADQNLRVCGPNGRMVGYLYPVSTPQTEEEIIIEAKRRLAADEPRHSGKQVQQMLQALDKEWARTGGFNEAYMHAFVNGLRSVTQ